MLVDPADRHVVEWAARHASPCYYTNEPGLPSPCLKVQCGAVTAYFSQGRLARLWAQADSPLLGDMFKSLTQIFALNTTRAARNTKRM